MSMLLPSADPAVTTTVDVTDDGLGLIVQHRADVSELLEHNDALRNEIGKGLGGTVRPVARISGILLAELIAQGIISQDCGDVLDQRRFRAWLNDRDNRRWRVSEGTV